MFKGKRILAVIPARGGSKGLPRKNLRKIGGRTLVEWALHTAQGCSTIDRIIVSSDAKPIIRIVNRYGEYAPFARPAELATDKSPSLPVFQHALRWAEKEDKCTYDYILALEPSCPFRLPEHINNGIDLISDTKSTSIMSLVEVSDAHPIRIKKLSPKGKITPFCMPEPEGLRRQDQEPAYIRNGAVLVFLRETMMKNRLWGDNPYGFVMDYRLYRINIDEDIDLAGALYLYRKLKKQGQLQLIDITATK